MKTRLHFAACLSLLLALPMAHAQDNPEVAALNQRLVAIDADPVLNSLASLERMQARQAVQALAAARSRQRPRTSTTLPEGPGRPATGCATKRSPISPSTTDCPASRAMRTSGRSITSASSSPPRPVF